MTKSPRKNVSDVGIKLVAACMPSELASDRATAPGLKHLWTDNYNVDDELLYLTAPKAKYTLKKIFVIKVVAKTIINQMEIRYFSANASWYFKT